MSEDAGRDLTAKEGSPTFEVDEVISELAASMVSDGYVMSGSQSYWVAFIILNAYNPETDLSNAGMVFVGLYSTHKRAEAAARGIGEAIIRDNHEQFPNIEINSSIVETFVDVIPKGDMFTHTTTEEKIDPEDL